MLREEQIDIRRQRRRRGAVPHPEPRPQSRLQRLPGHQPDDRRPVSRQHPRLRRRRQHLRMSRFPHQHARHLQAHRGRARRPAGRDAAATAPPQGRRHPSGNLPALRRATAPRPASAAAPLRSAARACPTAFFDPHGPVEGRRRAIDELIELVEKVPEQVTIFSDAMEFMEREIERREMAQREHELLAQARSRASSRQPCTICSKVPLYPYQMRGAVFAACRGRCILGDDMGLGKTVQTLAAVELLARERGIERVLVVAPASVKYQWETEIRKYTGRPCRSSTGTAHERRGAVSPADVLSAHQLRNRRARPRRAERLAARPDRARRGPAHQELGGEDDAGRQEAAQPLRPRADRHAAGEQARRAVQHRAVRR